VAHRFPDNYLHLGGDEVNIDCWKSNPNIAKWMQEQGMGKNYSLLEQYYEQRYDKLQSCTPKLGYVELQ